MGSKGTSTKFSLRISGTIRDKPLYWWYMRVRAVLRVLVGGGHSYVVGIESTVVYACYTWDSLFGYIYDSDFMFC